MLNFDFDAKLFLVLIIDNNLKIIMQWHLNSVMIGKKFSGFRENVGVDY